MWERETAPIAVLSRPPRPGYVRPPLGGCLPVLTQRVGIPVKLRTDVGDNELAIGGIGIGRPPLDAGIREHERPRGIVDPLPERFLCDVGARLERLPLRRV